MGAPRWVAQALVPAVSRLVSTRVVRGARCRTKSVPRSGDAAGMSACATGACSPSFEHLAQRFRGVAFLMAGHLFGGAGNHDAAAVLAAIGPPVDDPIRSLHYIQIMLDYHHRVAQVHQALQNLEQFADIVEVQAGGRLIEQVKGAAGLALAEFLGQLDTLRLAAGERGGGLSEVDVAQAYVVQRL